MLLVVYSSACAIFISILSLVAELSPLELVNFTKSLLSRALLLLFCKYWSNVCVYMKLCICNFYVHLSVRPSIHGQNFVRSFSPTVLHVLLWKLHIMFVCIWSCAYAIFMSVHLSVDTILSGATLTKPFSILWQKPALWQCAGQRLAW